MPSYSAATILLFGITSFAAGATSLIWPAPTLAALDLPTSALPAARGNSLAAIAMGIYYTLGAYQNNRAFFLATVPMRLLTTAVFWGQNWRAAALWEGIGALLTGLALGYEHVAAQPGSPKGKKT
ncbi:hypothetical protein B0T24DRAFT_642878 [Lasiosphaeria ovina]|uniref:Uncharacterized protein n=1 Tax=Lasiosphaeria ovina TaxID=92902 RepID=A0AAE0JTH2_9PEZI|nr:hypothetical protein B0T24DRAFT_642878 [Lasiosphaeria ovina]